MEVIKRSIIRWTGHVWRFEKILGYTTRQILDWKRPRQIQSIKKDLRMIEVVNTKNILIDNEKRINVVVAVNGFYYKKKKK